MDTPEESNQSVSVVVDRQVLPGNKDEFEVALKDIIEACSSFPGYLSTNVSSKQKGQEFHYRVVFRYESLEKLKAWESSS